MALLMTMEFFIHLFLLSFLPSSVISVLQDLEPQKDQGLDATQKLFSGRFPGHHQIRIICRGYGGNFLFAKLFLPL